MHEIICPHCGKAFTIDETGYADIVKQVRDSEFEQQLHERLELAAQDKQKAVELAEMKAAGELQKAAAAKDTEIQELKSKLDAGEAAQKIAVTEALSAVEKERDALVNELEQAKQEKRSTVELADAKLVNELQKAATTKDSEIQGLKAKLDAVEVAQKLAITEAVSAVEKERDGLKSGLERVELEKPKGGRPFADDKRCFAGIVYQLRHSIRWNAMPAEFPSDVTYWRRFDLRTKLGLWPRVHAIVLEELQEAGLLDTSEFFADATFAEARKGGLHRPYQM